MKPTIKELVKDTVVKFDSYRAGVFYYNVYNPNETMPTKDKPKGNVYQFQVPVEDIGNATLLSTDKAITYMRWIRKSLEGDTLIKL